MRRAFNAFVGWLQSQPFLPGCGPKDLGEELLQQGVLDLGIGEPPPQGWLRRLGYHARMLWRRLVAELKADWPLLKPRLWVIIPCLVFQYVHAIFTGMAYYMHTPLPVDNTTLHDLGFEALPYLDVDAVSEVMVYVGFAQFFVWLLSPLVTRRKTFSAAVVLKRVLAVLVACQILRILTFLSTQIPAPAPHCRAPEPTSNVPWPVWWQVIIVNVGRQASKGCGDLIFSSHLTFLLVFAWTYCRLGRYLALKLYAFCYAAATALCIIASRKHYTVDVTVASYVVPLVAWHYFRTWTHVRDDVATADNRRLVSLLPHPAPPTSGAWPPPDGGREGSRKPSEASQGHAVAAAAGGGASAALGDAYDVELAGQPPLDPSPGAPGPLEPRRASGGAWDPGSPVKQAWGALTGRVGSRTASHHRRTDSQEPVLGMCDHSSAAAGQP